MAYANHVEPTADTKTFPQQQCILVVLTVIATVLGCSTQDEKPESDSGVGLDGSQPPSSRDGGDDGGAGQNDSSPAQDGSGGNPDSGSNDDWGGPTPGAGVQVMVNPYSSVRWNSWHQYKANFHTHTKRSDGQATPAQVIDFYADADYSILALTDHDWITWPWTDYERNPDQLGMLAVRGDEWSQSDHLNAFFDFSRERSNLENGIPHIQAEGGLCQINHPGRESEPSDWEWYFNWYRDYPACVGMEVINRNDHYDRDRHLWDNVNEALYEATGRFVWGLANDDMHDPSNDLYRSFQFMLMPSLTESALRDSMEDGTFYFCTEPGGSGEARVPRITKIDVNNARQTITLTASDFESIDWIGPGTTVEQGGRSFDFASYEGRPFIRAVLHGSHGDCYTQPFGFVTM
jgi:hypothetical protein